MSLRTNMKYFFFFCILYVFAGNINAQTSSAQQLPRQIFVGDYASLIVPFFSSATSNTITKTIDLPTHKYIDFHKISLHPDRLIIEFTAWATGELEFPLIEIGGFYFSNFKIHVESTIDTGKAISLSSPASSLIMPGTAAMLYGIMISIVVIIIFGIWFFVKGKKLFSIWKEKWIRRNLFTSMRQTERRIYRALHKNADKRQILDKLSSSFRNFLSILLGQNCRSMTSQEFLYLPNDLPCNLQTNIHSFFLESFFSRCDSYRFSGSSVSSDQILQLLTELRNFLDTAWSQIQIREKTEKMKINKEGMSYV